MLNSILMKNQILGANLFTDSQSPTTGGAGKQNDWLFEDNSDGEISLDSFVSRTQEAKPETNSGLNINGQIDKGTKQSRVTGDCWLLSGLNSLSYSEGGKKLLSDAIKINDDGTYTVNFKGVNWTHSFTEADLKNAKASNKYSSGDDDMLLLEKAVDTLFEEIKSGKTALGEGAPDFNLEDKGNLLTNGVMRNVIYLFTGEMAYYQYKSDDDEKRFSYKTGIGNDVNQAYRVIEKNAGKIAASVMFKGKDGQSADVKDINGETVTLTSGGAHAWSIKSVSGDNVTIVNTYDTSKEITLSKEAIEPYLEGISYYKFK